MKLLAKMYTLVAESFKNKTDKQGRPYIDDLELDTKQKDKKPYWSKGKLKYK